jgi:iron complex outermembrane receptor protein
VTTSNKFRRALMSGAATGMALFFAAGHAQAQDAAPATQDANAVEEIVVTGIRKGIQDAIVAKKNSAQIVEAVSAEDIGKLPDVSIAESISRLPGIAAQRVNGRAQTLSIRGLGPDYTLTTLNGREQVSTNDNRSVEFDQYPSELISQVVVYKTPNAGMVAQGLAGTADLQTIRPLAYGRRALAVNFRKEMNSEKAAIPGMSDKGERYSLTYIDQFLDGKVGLALGYAHTNSPYQTLKKEAWGYPTCSAAVCAADSTKLIVGGEKDAINAGVLKRDGYLGVLEFAPNDSFHATLDAYHSDFKELQRIARIEFPLAWGANHLAPGYTTGGDRITSGSFTDVNAVLENYINQREAKLDSAGLNMTYDLGDEWSFLADASYSRVKREDIQIESTAGTGVNGSGSTSTIGFTTNANGITQINSTADYSNFDTVYLTDPGGWGGPAAIRNRAGYLRLPTTEDEIKAIKVQATRHMDGLFSGITAGFNYTEHTKDKDATEGYLELKTAAQEKVPEAFRRGVVNTSFLGNNKGMINYDALGLYQSGYFDFLRETGSESTKKTWSVSEKISTYFLRGDIDTTLGGRPLTGNIGVQVVHADQGSRSFYTDGTEVTDQSGGAKYTNTLPTLNLNWRIADDTTVRFGAGVTLARPRMDDMASGSGYSVQTLGQQPIMVGTQGVYWSESGGNPNLRPWKATNYDLSIEKYFGTKGYISAAVFYKDLSNYAYSMNVLKDFSSTPLPGTACYVDPQTKLVPLMGRNQETGLMEWVCANANTNRTGKLSVMQNAQGGYIRGAEATLSLPADVIWSKAEGFGLIISGSLNDSAVDPLGTGDIEVPGLSKKIVNTTVYFEKYGFSARVSNRYRSAFLGEVPDYTNALGNKLVHSESVFDAQIGYTLQSGPAKGLSISLSAQNLSNEPFYTYTKSASSTTIDRYEKYGSTYQLGLSYRW